MNLYLNSIIALNKEFQLVPLNKIYANLNELILHIGSSFILSMDLKYFLGKILITDHLSKITCEINDIFKQMIICSCKQHTIRFLKKNNVYEEFIHRLNTNKNIIRFAKKHMSNDYNNLFDVYIKYMYYKHYNIYDLLTQAFIWPNHSKWIDLNVKFTISITNYLRTPNKHL